MTEDAKTKVWENHSKDHGSYPVNKCCIDTGYDAAMKTAEGISRKVGNEMAARAISREIIKRLRGNK